MTLAALHQAHGAVLAPDGIPLHYGDLAAEYRAGLEAAILLDRSHEGRLRLAGADRYEFLNRMSTNKLTDLAAGEGRATLFINANARILERASVYNTPDDLLLIAEPGRGEALYSYLQRHIFFNDKVTLSNISTQTALFALHGPQADAVLATLDADLPRLPALFSRSITAESATFFVARRKAISGSHWAVVAPIEIASSIYRLLLAAGQPYGLRPAGSLTYNTLRIRGGYPAGREISSEYLPLEVGLWDDVHFAKGCYTGQEIIARMESRARIARTLVALQTVQPVDAPCDVYQAGKAIGTLTSSVQAPDGVCYGLAVIKAQAAQVGTALTLGAQHHPATIIALPGAQPPYLAAIIAGG